MNINDIEMSVRAESAIMNYNWRGDAVWEKNILRTDAIVTRDDLKKALRSGKLRRGTVPNCGARTIRELYAIAGLQQEAYRNHVKCPTCGHVFPVSGNKTEAFRNKTYDK